MGGELRDLSSRELDWVTKTEKCDLVWTTTETTIPWHQHCATAREKLKTENGKRDWERQQRQLFRFANTAQRQEK
jgi:hypothetical protein